MRKLNCGFVEFAKEVAYLSTHRSTCNHLSLVEFYVIDVFELSHYLPIYFELMRRGIESSIVIEPYTRNTTKRYLKFLAAVKMLSGLGVRFYTKANENAPVAITTQHSSVLSKYKRNKISVPYGTSFIKNYFGHVAGSCDGFSAKLVHGAYSVEKLHGVIDDNKVFIVGYPRYDNFFSGTNETEAGVGSVKASFSKKILTYFPTWDEDKSILMVEAFFESIRNEYAIVTKPHHCTAQLSSLADDLNLVNRFSDMVLDSTASMTLGALAADVIVADAKSGAGIEAKYLNEVPLMLISPKTNIVDFFDPQIFDFSCVATPETPMNEVFSEALVKRNSIDTEFLLGPRDGLSSKRAVDVITQFI